MWRCRTRRSFGNGRTSDSGWTKTGRILRFGRRLEVDADEWENTLDTGALLRGARLLKAEEWSVEHPDAPSAVQSFVRASRSAEDEEHTKKLSDERALREAAEDSSHRRDSIA